MMIDNRPVIEALRLKYPLTEKELAVSGKEKTRISMSLCGILRHKPQSVGVELDEQGYTDALTLTRQFSLKKKSRLSMSLLLLIVSEDEKTRYGLKLHGDRLLIRCNQGHSVEGVVIDFKQASPPALLYHGTRTAFLDSIFSEGLKPMKRQYVHLSADIPTAKKVSGRHSGSGLPCILKVDAAAMERDGLLFYLSDNDVWLTKSVDPVYISL